jgi:hypothetical protein
MERTISLGVKFLKTSFTEAILTLNAVATGYNSTLDAIQLLVHVGSDVFAGVLHSSLEYIDRDPRLCALIFYDFQAPFHLLRVQLILDVPLLRKSLQEGLNNSHQIGLCSLANQIHHYDLSIRLSRRSM